MRQTRRNFMKRSVAVMAAELICRAAPQAMAANGKTPAELLNRPPKVDPSTARSIAPGVTIIEDPRINLVPNVGIIEGDEAVLVVETGLGRESGSAVYELARRYAGERQLWLTLTHFHPEHGYGAEIFKGNARIVYNLAQAEELADKGQSYLELFATFGPHVAAELSGVSLVEPDETYQGRREIDLGGRRVVMREMPAHTRGDQIVLLPEDGIVFTGDLVENAFYPILPDKDAHGGVWIERMREIEALGASVLVPGHGAVGDATLAAHYREYLTYVRDEVAGAVDQGMTPDQADAHITPAIQGRYKDWDNDFWASFAVRVFHSELSGAPLELPPF